VAKTQVLALPRVPQHLEAQFGAHPFEDCHRARNVASMESSVYIPRNRPDILHRATLSISSRLVGEGEIGLSRYDDVTGSRYWERLDGIEGYRPVMDTISRVCGHSGTS